MVLVKVRVSLCGRQKPALAWRPWACGQACMAQELSFRQSSGMSVVMAAGSCQFADMSCIFMQSRGRELSALQLGCCVSAGSSIYEPGKVPSVDTTLTWATLSDYK